MPVGLARRHGAAPASGRDATIHQSPPSRELSFAQSSTVRLSLSRSRPCRLQQPGTRRAAPGLPSSQTTDTPSPEATCSLQAGGSPAQGNPNKRPTHAAGAIGSVETRVLQHAGLQDGTRTSKGWGRALTFPKHRNELRLAQRPKTVRLTEETHGAKAAQPRIWQ